MVDDAVSVSGPEGEGYPNASLVTPNQQSTSAIGGHVNSTKYRLRLVPMSAVIAMPTKSAYEIYR